MSKTINLCNIDTLCETINLIILDKLNKYKINLFEKESYELGQLVKKIASKNTKKIFFIPINYKYILFIIKIVEFLKIKSGFKSDSLKSLI